MTTLHRTDVASHRSVARLALFGTVAAQFALMFGAFGVLASSINWPQSLDLPASQALPLIQAQSGGIALGYSLYFLSAFLLIPLTVLLHRVLRQRTVHFTTLHLAGVLGVGAGVLKLLGIVRWLAAMPALAATYAAGDASTRTAVGVMYDTLNNYAGGVGETLGVQLFAGLWTLLISLVVFRLPRGRVLGAAGLASGLLLLLGLTELFGTDLGPVLTVQGIVWQVWLLALGVTFLRAPSPSFP
ncbi:DUF4386 domain-containing protein [Deinococcus oregonensis]|uniref:DUF4386 domain-containing protein n=1 Tax=Deinococcus oregonensis TaxID=1805970 RepID=A0ABV6AXG1_9DEIO